MISEEILDLVDKSDNTIGTMTRRSVYAEGLSNFRVINAFLISPQGHLWIPRRNKNKTLFPFHLDASVGGHVSAGESYLNAFIRELQEELNLSLSDFNYQEINKLTPHDDGVSAFMKTYLIDFDESQTLEYNANDICSGEWLTPDMALFKLKNGDMGKGDLPTLIQSVKKWLINKEQVSI